MPVAEVQFVEEEDRKDQNFYDDVLTGLSQTPKTLPCKYFYDKKGSELFEKICELDEYYVTRAELEILDTFMDDISHTIGAEAAIIEPGSGAGEKIKLLLSSLKKPQSFTAIEISHEILERSTSHLHQMFPALRMHALAGDFTQVLSKPELLPEDARKAKNRVVFFPGSTLGNFERDKAELFLRNIATFVGPGGGLLIGVDMDKDPQVLTKAYDDDKGVTAQFNKNVLERANRELESNFDTDSFTHEARYNSKLRRIEMHLVSTIEQDVDVLDKRFKFEAGETIHTENSHKYTLNSFAELGNAAGFDLVKHWTDKESLFSVFYLRAK